MTWYLVCVYMLKGFCLLHIWFLFTHSDSLFYSDSFLMMIFLFVLVTCLSISFSDEIRNLVNGLAGPNDRKIHK